MGGQMVYGVERMIIMSGSDVVTARPWKIIPE